jgi:hypothetical protein
MHTNELWNAHTNWWEVQNGPPLFGLFYL